VESFLQLVDSGRKRSRGLLGEGCYGGLIQSSKDEERERGQMAKNERRQDEYSVGYSTYCPKMPFSAYGTMIPRLTVVVVEDILDAPAHTQRMVILRKALEP
jgi:hypothetical protein